MSLPLAAVVDSSARVSATRSRTQKVSALAELLARAAPDEVAAAVGFLTGVPRQGRIGVGWAAVAALDVSPAPRPTLTVADVDAALEAIVATTGGGSAARRHVILSELFARATENEAGFLRRLIVGELRQGALHGLITDAAAKAVGAPGATFRRAVMLHGDLGEVAELARREGPEALDAVTLSTLRPVLPMLAASAVDVGAALTRTGRSSVEWKLDGARIQAHRLDDDVRIFTRNLNDVTDRLPGIARLVREMPARELVLDGEAVGLRDNERPHRFQDTMSAFGADAPQSDGTVLQAVFFDCLRRDGVDLLDRPLVDRRAVLEAVAGSACVPALATDDPVRASRVLDEALATGHEGVVVKSLESRYEAGRRGSAWIKVKPVRTLDLVVLAAEWGHGRRRGWLSNLHLGAREPAGAGFLMVGKTFKGLTDELLSWQTARLQELEERRTDHIVHVRPELVVEIALDGVQASSRYAGGVALRFARVRRFRDDKTPADADTIDDVRAMLQ